MALPLQTEADPCNENDGTGTEPFTKNVFVTEEAQPMFEVIVSETMYDPVFVYLCCGSFEVDVLELPAVASPKSQLYVNKFSVPSAIELLSINEENGSLRQLCGSMKSATGNAPTLICCEDKKLLHPEAVSTNKLAVFVPDDV
jgi:hypothetical protein